MTKPSCKSVFPWLEANLGKRCLAPLTDHDSFALKAAVHIAELWGRSSSRLHAAFAFRFAVLEMQPHTRYFAFHAIAHVLDWSHRMELWTQADLPREQIYGICAFSPEARAKGGAQ
jgi:hypothetical protein